VTLDEFDEFDESGGIVENGGFDVNWTH